MVLWYERTLHCKVCKVGGQIITDGTQNECTLRSRDLHMSLQYSPRFLSEGVLPVSTIESKVPDDDYVT